MRSGKTGYAIHAFVGLMLRTHDKEAMALKKLKVDDMDKEGLRESEIRKRFNGIMYSYGLANPSTKRNEGGLSENQVRKFLYLFRHEN